MIQYSKELSENIQKVQSFNEYCYLQKIYSSATLICLTARFRKRTQYLYLGRGSGVEGFWLADEKIPTGLRRIDRFLEYLRKHLTSVLLIKVSQIFSDRCIRINYRKHGFDNSFVFFWKGRTLYFLNHYYDISAKGFYLMKSWDGKAVKSFEEHKERLCETLQEIGLDPQYGRMLKDSNTSARMAVQKEQQRLIKSNCSSKKIKFLKKKVLNIDQDLRKIKSAEILQDKILSGGVNFEQLDNFFKFNEIKFKLDKNMNLFQKRDRIFKKIKGYKSAKKMLEERRRLVKSEVASLEKGHVLDSKNDLKVISPFWVSSEKKEKKIKTPLKHNIRVFKSIEQVVFAVGMDAVANDFLRSQWGGRDDFLFHLDGYRGSHLVVRESNWEKMGVGLLNVIASSLRDFSGEEINEVPILFTRVRNTKGFRGSKGKIIYKKEKYMKIDYDKNWRDYVEEL